jgi:hypothetical protein
MLTWAGAGWAEAKQIRPVAIVRIPSVRMVVAFELVEPQLDLTGFPLGCSQPFGFFCPLSLITKKRPQNPTRSGALISSRFMHY